MKKLLFYLTLASFVILPNFSFADGKFYRFESVPPEIPYQRALLIFDGNQEILILQSKFKIESLDSNFIGWVVPVPAIPNLASMKPSEARNLFSILSSISRPDVTRISEILALFLILLFPVGFIILLICLLSFFDQKEDFVRRYRRKLIKYALLGMIIGFVAFFFMPFYRVMEQGVDIVKEEKVGIYNVKVVKSDSPTEIIQWLNQNQFNFNEADTKVFSEYLRNDWCFVVAQIDTRINKEEIISEGLVAPLIVKFPTETPIYPLTLTSTIGYPTQILLYVLGPKKFENDGRLKLHFADNINSEIFNRFKESVEPRGFFSKNELQHRFLCKFKGTLKPKQMQEDLELNFTEDNKPYRERSTIW